MKYLKIFFFIIVSFFVFGCDDNKGPEVENLNYEMKVGELLTYETIAPNVSLETFSGVYLYVEATNEGIKATSEGVEIITVLSNDEKNKYNITITIQGSLTKINVENEFVIRYLETKEIEFTVDGAKKEDVFITSNSSNLEIEGFNITSLEDVGGIIYLQVKNKPETKVEVKVIIEDISLTIKNESFDINNESRLQGGIFLLE